VNGISKMLTPSDKAPPVKKFKDPVFGGSTSSLSARKGLGPPKAALPRHDPKADGAIVMKAPNEGHQAKFNKK
jgi:hypothetical protein